jgi:DNA transformation protein and related proteins
VADSPEFIAFIKEQMAGFAPVTMRRMFGGAGAFHDGLMFALIVNDCLYLKADEATKSVFEAEGLQPFTYGTKNGKRTVMSYWRAPERCLDDPDEMRDWARRAHAVALKAAAAKR